MKVPVAGLAPCADGKVCVPDKILEANGTTLKACTFFLPDTPKGACLSVLSDDVAANEGTLEQDACDPDERCTPCVDPRDKSDTHLCDPVGVHEQACVGGTGTIAESCCHGSGVCILETAIPEDQRGELRREVCAAGNVCAPAAMVDGNPRRCEALGFDGVCLDVCFAELLRAAGTTMRASCGPTEVCLPCFIGEGRGMPGCTTDGRAP
jgi:hypothetical protein